MDRPPRTRLDQLIQLSKRTITEHCDDFQRTADQHGEKRASLSYRQLQRWMAGDITDARAASMRVAELHWGEPFEVLVGPPKPHHPVVAPVSRHDLADWTLAVGDSGMEPSGEGDERDLRRLLNQAAVVSAQFGQWVGSPLGDLALNSYLLRIRQCATDLVHRPMVPIFHELVALRDELFTQVTIAGAKQQRDLYVFAGLTCGLLAQATVNLGDRRAADVQAGVAMLCALQADEPGLATWVGVVRALQYEWAGQPDRALEFLAEAQQHSDQSCHTGSTAVWVQAIAARAHARLGQVEAMEHALSRAERARQLVDQRPGERSIMDELGGILAFPAAKQHFYAGGAYRRAGQAHLARASSQAALDAYAAAPADERSYGDMVLAGVDLAIAHTQAESLDEAAELVNDLAELPTELCLPIMVEPLVELEQAVVGSRLRTSRAAIELRDSAIAVVSRCADPVRTAS